jgi:hypothetical protein
MLCEYSESAIAVEVSQKTGRYRRLYGHVVLHDEIRSELTAPPMRVAIPFEIEIDGQRILFADMWAEYPPEVFALLGVQNDPYENFSGRVLTVSTWRVI